VKEFERELDKLRSICDCEACRGNRQEAATAMLHALAEYGDPEVGHSMADKILLAIIDDEAVTAAFESLTRWYA